MSLDVTWLGDNFPIQFTAENETKKNVVAIQVKVRSHLIRCHALRLLLIEPNFSFFLSFFLL
jgi:hypothetical protein